MLTRGRTKWPANAENVPGGQEAAGVCEGTIADLTNPKNEQIHIRRLMLRQAATFS
jgi:hypothetical protein